MTIVDEYREKLEELGFQYPGAHWPGGKRLGFQKEKMAVKADGSKRQRIEARALEDDIDEEQATDAQLELDSLQTQW